jgi:hypothetical protein
LPTFDARLLLAMLPQRCSRCSSQKGKHTKAAIQAAASPENNSSLDHHHHHHHVTQSSHSINASLDPAVTATRYGRLLNMVAAVAAAGALCRSFGLFVWVPAFLWPSQFKQHHCHHHHHHVTQSSHSINVIGPAPLWSGRKREHCQWQLLLARCSRDAFQGGRDTRVAVQAAALPEKAAWHDLTYVLECGSSNALARGQAHQ